MSTTMHTPIIAAKATELVDMVLFHCAPHAPAFSVERNDAAAFVAASLDRFVAAQLAEERRINLELRGLLNATIDEIKRARAGR